MKKKKFYLMLIRVAYVKGLIDIHTFDRHDNILGTDTNPHSIRFLG